MRSSDLVNFLAGLFGALRVFALLLIFYIYITYSLSLFSATQAIASELAKYSISLSKAFFAAILDYVPNLLSILLIVFITFYILKFAKFLVRAIYFQQLVYKSFKQEWIQPTFQIARFFIIAFALVMVFPYLPGADSPAFKGISVFLGVLISFGSGSAIANIIAGVVLIYMSPYSRGDRVKVGEITGDIKEMNLLVTRIRTIKNEDVTIPNSLILAKEVVNYSSSANSDSQLVIGVKVGLGYDIPQERVTALLKEAAANLEDVSKEPEPFVFVTELAGSFVEYELNVYTKNSSKMAFIKSALLAETVKIFHANDLEVLSPTYITTRAA